MAPPARIRPLGAAAAFAALTLLVHLLTNRGYGFFRDELYFLACAEHLDWGFPDQPPLIALLAWFSRHFLGESLGAIRFLPALAGAGKVFLTGLIAAELGGGVFAVALACLCVLAAPVFLGTDTILTMNAFEPLFWMGCAYLALRAIRHGRPRLWLWVGALAGIGLQNKHSMALFLAALAAGLVLSPQRRVLLTGWFWAGMAIALALFLPNLIWQYSRGWPALDVLQTARRTGKNVALAPLSFVGQQIQMMGPAALLVWAAGLWFLLRHKGREFRFLGWTFVIVFGLLLALKGKNYYLAPAYPMLFAAGGAWWEQWTRSVRFGRAVRAALVALIAVSGVLLGLLVLPVLPPEKYVAYSEALGVSVPKTEVAHIGPLPQLLGDMFGWPEMVAAVAKLYHSLPPEERAKAAIFAGNYGEAGAIDFFGPRHGLPKAISGHMAYHEWGPRGASGEVIILLQTSREDAEKSCASVQDGPVVAHPWAMAEEHYTVLVCRGLKTPIEKLWPNVRHRN